MSKAKELIDKTNPYSTTGNVVSTDGRTLHSFSTPEIRSDGLEYSIAVLGLGNTKNYVSVCRKSVFDAWIIV